MLGKISMEDYRNERLFGPGIEDFMKFPSFESVEEERLHGKQRLAAAFRLAGRFGFMEGVAGHISYRDPELKDHFWTNPYGVHFRNINVSNLILANSNGEVVKGDYSIHKSHYYIHREVYKARPDVNAVAHVHSVNGRAWSVFGRLLDPLTQDSCHFHNDLALLDDYAGIVYEDEEGKMIANALKDKKAAILKHHGLLTVGQTIDAAAFWLITLERSCEVQLLAEAAGGVKPMDPETANLTASQMGREVDGWEGFQPLWHWIVKEEPDLLD